MSSPKYKLHFATSIIQTLKEIKSLILPAIIVLVANGFKLSFTSIESLMESIPVLIILIIFIITITRGIVKWLTFTYWIEEQELKTEYGLLFKNKRYVPLERIQSLNTNEGIIHRLFNVVQISIETAGGSSKKAEVELTAITKEAAAELEQMIQQQRSDVFVGEEQHVSHERNVIYQMSNKDLLLLATTSNGIMIVLGGIGAVFSQVSEYIPYEKISEQFASLFEFGVLFIVFMIMIGLIIAWVISVGMTYLAYYSFKVSYDNEQVEITRGLINKKKMVIPVSKIQAIKVVENPIRQLFGYANVTLENAGTVVESSTESKVVLLPFIKKASIEQIVRQIDQAFSLNMANAHKSPHIARPLFYRKYIYLGVIASAVGAYFISPYFLLVLVAAALLAMLGIVQHKDSSVEMNEQIVRAEYRVISKVFYFVKRNKIQACEVSQHWFQRRLNVYTNKLFVVGNSGSVRIKIPHQGEEATRHLQGFMKKDV